VTVADQLTDPAPAEATAPVYVYGVVRAGAIAPTEVEGVAGRPVETIESGGLAAVTSELGGDRLRVRRRDLLGHLRVLETVFAENTIVPCAFGMVLPSRHAVENELLAGRRQELVALLERLDGRIQLNVTASYDEEAVLREIVQEDPEIVRLRARTRALGAAGHFESIRLGERVARALEERRAVDAERLLGRLAREAEDAVVDQAAETVVLKASFLVAGDRRASFDAALEDLASAEAPRITFESIGPLPPTVFAELDG
jgi:Gas vesicle synthesis protein GvpL/GvpF